MSREVSGLSKSSENPPVLPFDLTITVQRVYFPKDYRMSRPSEGRQESHLTVLNSFNFLQTLGKTGT